MLAISTNGSYLAGEIAGSLVVVLGAWGLFGRKRRHWLVGIAATAFLWAAIVSWISQFHLVHRIPSLSYSNVNPVINVAVSIAVLCFMRFMRFRPVWTTLLVAYVFDQLLQTFAFLYWSYGGGSNFTTHLTHLDSLYFALGTLTTAGTGNIAAVSESARRIQTVQMFVDLVLIVFAVGIVIARASTYLAQRKAEVR